jgi:carboxypeptidase T
MKTSTLTTIASALFAMSGCIYLQTATARDTPAQIKALQEREKVATNIYEAYFPSLDIAHKAAVSFHEMVLETNYETGYLVMELDQIDRAKLRAFGFTFRPAKRFMAQRKTFLDRIQTATTQQTIQAQVAVAGAPSAKILAAIAAPPTTIPGYPCYETVEETFAQAQALATTTPNLAQWLDVGDSWEKTSGLGGYDIKVLKLTNKTILGNKPKLFVNSAIHAREYATAALNLAFARWLIQGYGVNADATWILDHHEVHLMLQTNPDGRKKAEAGLAWRKNTNEWYCGSKSSYHLINSPNRGADLNRNFSYTFNSTNGQGSSSDQCSETFRGPWPSSEPETQALEGYVRNLWPDQRGPNLSDGAPRTTSGIHIDLHSYGKLVMWPWGMTATPAANALDLQTLGRKLAYFNGYRPQQSIGLYPTDGTTSSISYGELGVAAYTIEVGTSFFESCSNYNNTLKPNNLSALIYAAKVARTPYITPYGPDITYVTLSGTASTIGVKAGTSLTLDTSATLTRFNNTNGIQAVSFVAGGEYYIDVPPWVTGAIAKPLMANDRIFNSATESMYNYLNTTGLKPGKHTVFVRAKDRDGNWGSISAVFLLVI